MSKIKNMCITLLCGAISLCASDIESISKTEGVLSSKQLSHFKDLFEIDSFIETGTYAGDTTEEAAKVFAEVYSIEIYEPLYEKAQKRFSQHPNVSLYLGDTSTQLYQMISDSSGNRLYWLDAHSSGGGTGGVPGFSPILHELDQIYNHGENNESVILIDDMRGMCHCDSRTNLPLREIIQKINEISPDLHFYSIGDIGIIFNEKSYPFLSISDIVKNASISRFFNPLCENEATLEELIEAESFIAACGQNTQEEKNFCNLIGWVNKKELGGEVIYLLWEALREMEQKKYTDAAQDFKLITKSFYSHWRIDAYHVKALLLAGQSEEATTLFNQKLLQAYAKHPKLIEKIINTDIAPLIK